MINYNDCTVVDGKYEYSKTNLDGNKAKYIYIPISVITDTELGMRRVGIFAYLRVHYGLNAIDNFTIPDIVEWCGEKPSRKINGTNDKYLTIIDWFSDRGYITYLTERSRCSYMKCMFDTEEYVSECSNGYACVYLDEIEKIMNYKKENQNDHYLSNNIILLVFAYLRNKIIRRPNELKPEERHPDKVKNRRERIPEAYNETYRDIGKELGISERLVSDAVKILNQLNLIVYGEPKKIVINGNEYRTPDMIFANYEKREAEFSLIKGEDYAYAEIEQKAVNMSKKGYYPYRLKKVS